MPFLSLLQIFWINDHNLYYLRMTHAVFSDNMFVLICSKRGKKFPKCFGWCQVFLMRSKDDGYDALVIVFTKEYMLHAYLCNDVKEMM